jgi:tetratricopeptide (TPR) repeat protein
MTYNDYLTTKPPASFKTYDAIVQAQDLLHSRLNVPQGSLPKLLGVAMNAHAGADPSPGRFPLVLYVDGLQGDTMSQVVLEEYLASYGFVVSTIPITGRSSDRAAQTSAQPGLETTIRDLEFSWSILRKKPQIDPAKLAVLGHSLGAAEAVLFAMRNSDVSAVVGLDGTYGFVPSTLTGFYDYNPLRMSAALLDLRRAQMDTGPSAFVLDLSAVEALHFSPRTLVTLKGMYHTDFTVFGILAKEFNFPPFADRNYDTGSAGYQSTCRIVRDYLSIELLGESAAEAQFANDVAAAPGGASKELAAVPLPPSPQQLVDIAVKVGLDAAKAIIQKYKQDAPDSVVVGEGAYNSLGYSLLAQKQMARAIAALELDSFVYPGSANIADSLGDMYAAAGQIEKARQAYMHALQILPADSEQDAAGKKDLQQTLLQAIQKLGTTPH